MQRITPIEENEPADIDRGMTTRELIYKLAVAVITGFVIVALFAQRALPWT